MMYPVKLKAEIDHGAQSWNLGMQSTNVPAVGDTHKAW